MWVNKVSKFSTDWGWFDIRYRRMANCPRSAHIGISLVHHAVVLVGAAGDVHAGERRQEDKVLSALWCRISRMVRLFATRHCGVYVRLFAVAIQDNYQWVATPLLGLDKLGLYLVSAQGITVCIVCVNSSVIRVLFWSIVASKSKHQQVLYSGELAGVAESEHETFNPSFSVLAELAVVSELANRVRWCQLVLGSMSSRVRHRVY
jgi:hypothetical protein